MKLECFDLVDIQEEGEILHFHFDGLNVIPAYIGFRRGSNVLRLGYSHPSFQDRTQNWVHRNGFLYLPFGHQHFYNDYSEFQRGNYFYSGYHNPFSLYGR